MGKMTAVILAAGAGTRMKSKLPKVIHEVSSKPMVEHVIDVAEENGVDRTIVVIGHEGEQVEKAIGHRNVQFAWQKEQLGTGHAVMQVAEHLKDEGDVLLLYGDTPLIRTETIQELIKYHSQGSYAATVLTAQFQDPTGYGRIVRGQDGLVKRIVEQKDASEEEKQIQEVNSGMYCYNGKLLKEALKNLTNNNVQKEYYITDVVELLNREGHKVGAYAVTDNSEISGVNSRMQLAEAEAVMRRRILRELMESGVTIIDPQQVYVDKGVKVGKDTILYPGVILKGKTEVGEGCIIGHNCRIVDSVIKNDVEIQSSTIVESFVDDACQIGPYAYLRPNSRLGRHVKIGDFVEVKNSTIGDYSKASHLAYVGDGEVGKHVNIGCGVVFVNYDGKHKHKAIVEDHAFVGSNVNLVAPVTVRKYGYVATGSTITKEVPEGALSVARAKQENKLGWVARKGLMK